MPKPGRLLRVATGAILVSCQVYYISSQTKRISKTLHRYVPEHDAPMVETELGERREQEWHPWPWTFSACLMIKDQNMLLPEWLAYHYTVLPLRRLIVGVDPHSITDPEPILDLFGSIGLNITVWRNESTYWQDWGGNLPHDKLDFQLTNTSTRIEKRDRHRKRQYHFYSGCLQRLRDEGWTWTAVIDTDEYLAFNRFDELEGAQSWCKGNATCEKIYLKSIRDGNNIRVNMTGTTAAEVMDNYPEALRYQDRGVWNDVTYDNPDKPCILLSRYVFVSKEDYWQLRSGGHHWHEIQHISLPHAALPLPGVPERSPEGQVHDKREVLQRSADREPPPHARRPVHHAHRLAVQRHEPVPRAPLRRLVAELPAVRPQRPGGQQVPGMQHEAQRRF